MTRLALALALALIASPALADPCTAPLPKPGTVFSGPVVYTVDADGWCVALGPDPSQWVEVRAADFYGVELNAPGGRDAKALTARLLMGRKVTCRAQGRSWDRVVASCTLNGEPVGQLIHRNGGIEGGRGR